MAINDIKQPVGGADDPARDPHLTRLMAEAGGEAPPAALDDAILAENLTEKDNVCIAARDIDGSGKCSIAVGAEWNPSDTVNSGAILCRWRMWSG